MTKAHGFPGERMLVVPAPRVREALAQPGTTHLVVTDSGYFPEARMHGRTRARPIPEAVIVICTKGAGWCRTIHGRFPVGAGQAVILPPGEAHAYAADQHDPWTVWWVHLRGRDLDEFLSTVGMTSEQPVRELADIFGVVALVAEVVRWMERDSTTGSMLAASGAAWHLLALLVSDRPVGDERSTSIDYAAAFLRDHPEERFDVAALAAMVRLSPSHFAALFKKQFGLPVLQYQTHLRMARARELLDTTRRPIPEVAASAGYIDSFYFSRQFRKIHGMTPLGYRHRNRDTAPGESIDERPSP